MPLYYYKNEPENVLGRSAVGLLSGLAKGLQLRKESSKETLAQAKAAAELNKLMSEAQEKQDIRSLLFGGQAPQPSAPTGARIDIPFQTPGGAKFIDPKTKQPQQPQRPIMKSFKYGGMDFVTPEYLKHVSEQKKKLQAEKPLAGDTASKFEAGEQANKNAQDLIDLYGFEKTPEGIKAKNFLRKKIKLKAAQVPQLPGLPGIVSQVAQLYAGDEGKLLDLALTTLAKNVYRSETGAAGNEAEIRDVKRRLVTRMTDSEKVALERILSSESFTRGVADAIRPGKLKAPVIPGVPVSRVGKYEILSVQ